MRTAKKSIKNYDLGFTAVCFACFLGIFTLGTNQTSSTKIAAECFAFSVPVLLASNILLSMFNLNNNSTPSSKGEALYKALGFATLAGMGSGLFGIGHMFYSITESSAVIFAFSSLACIMFIGLGVARYRNDPPDLPVKAALETDIEAPLNDQKQDSIG